MIASDYAQIVAPQAAIRFDIVTIDGNRIAVHRNAFYLHGYNGLVDSLQGRTLGGRYEIAELLGRGGTADTYRGLDKTLRRDVAVKVLVERSDETNARLLMEARAMARLNHPRIVAVYDAGEDSGISYIVMELVRGKTLSALEGGELGYKQALGYISEVLEALEYAN